MDNPGIKSPRVFLFRPRIPQKVTCSPTNHSATIFRKNHLKNHLLNNMLTRVCARSYSTGAGAIKVSAREAAGNLSALTVVVDNAGSKAGKAGVAHLLSRFNFLNTEPKSALRFTRESELLGGIVSSSVTRDAIVLKTQFLKQDLPYYVEALGNVLAKTSFRPFELPEQVLPVALAESRAASASNEFKAVEELHQLSFRTGLGQPLYYDGTTEISLDDIKSFAQQAYTADNVSLYASGVDSNDLNLFIAESALSALPSGSSTSVATKSFNNKESRIRAAGESVAVIGLPVKAADFGKYELLSAAVGSSLLPGAPSPLAKIPGATSQLLKYKDAGLFVVTVKGTDAQKVAAGIKEAKNVVSSADTKNATKAAELAVALQSSFDNPIDFKIGSASPGKLANFNYVAVGNVDVLPYIDEL